MRSVVLTRASLFTAAISYSVEADGDRRKQGLPSRVIMLNKTHTETDYQFNSTLDLRGQNQKTCVKILAKVKVNILQHQKHILYQFVVLKRQKNIFKNTQWQCLYLEIMTRLLRCLFVIFTGQH